MNKNRAQFSEITTRPDKLWFKAWKYGWGWRPATWQGWAIFAMYIFALVSLIQRAAMAHHANNHWLLGFIPQVYILTVFNIIVCYATGERPQWRWGTKEEFFEVLDEEGKKTGDVVSRADVHKKGLWHRAAHVYVVNSKGDVLLQRRLGNKSLRPGRWYISAGAHIRAGETSKGTAVRQLKEELGVVVPEGALLYAGTATKKHVLLYGTYINNEFDDIFVLRADLDLEKVKKAGNAFYDGEVSWFPISEFRKYIQGNDSNFVDYEGLPVLFSYLEQKS